MANQPLFKGENNSESVLAARQITLSGRVQGVGFRPFIYRLAVKHELAGWVRNSKGLVDIHVQGASKNIQRFVEDVFHRKPPLADPHLESEKPAEAGDYDGFNIIQSSVQGLSHISVPADLYLCDDCLAELNDPSDRRYRYPFINCTQCGPRYTLISSLPYDRPNTTMAAFKLCPQCRREYEDPADRRFHAEPVACPVCGPVLSFRAGEHRIEGNEASLASAVEVLRAGQVLAVKGIGGYHLMCDATNEQAVARLRSHKPRPRKPLAVMFPAPVDDPLRDAELAVELEQQDRAFLLQPARPILLVHKKKQSRLCEQIAPGLNEVGLMLPYSPLHHLLLNDFGGPLIATSANISGEPVLTLNDEVEARLGHVADAFLHHDRPIERPADDPVFRSIAGRPRPVRTGRGSAPMELSLPFELEQPVLAVGAHMKNVIALAWDSRVVISPHIGEMDSARSIEVFEKTIDDLQSLYEVKADVITHDAHPGYTTTRWANKQGMKRHSVYHHHAHASAAWYECNTGKPVIAFTWDGVGYGEDGQLWGGETFIGNPGQWQRVATMRSFRLPGGDKAGREPWRSAAALCWETGQDYADIPEKDPMLRQAWERGINAPVTTSAGRLFDAAAALAGVRSSASFEGQGPMELEASCNGTGNTVKIALEKHDNLLITNWEPLVGLMSDSTLTLSERASMFHSSLAQVILQQARLIRDEHGINTVTFSGGVFQNRVLTEQAMALLETDDFHVCLPELIPVNDAGISFGQIIEYGFKQ